MTNAEMPSPDSSMAVARPAGPPPTIRTEYTRCLTALCDLGSENSLVLDELARRFVENHKSKLRPEIDHVQVLVQCDTGDVPVPAHLFAGSRGHIVGALRRPPIVSTICEIGLPGQR